MKHLASLLLPPLPSPLCFLTKWFCSRFFCGEKVATFATAEISLRSPFTLAAHKCASWLMTEFCISHDRKEVGTETVYRLSFSHHAPLLLCYWVHSIRSSENCKKNGKRQLGGTKWCTGIHWIPLQIFKYEHMFEVRQVVCLNVYL